MFSIEKLHACTVNSLKALDFEIADASQRGLCSQLIRKNEQNGREGTLETLPFEYNNWYIDLHLFN